MPTLRETVPIKRRKIIKKSFTKVLAVLAFSSLLSVLLFYVLETLSLAEDGPVALFLQEYRAQIVSGWLCLVLLLVLWSPISQYLYFRLYFYDMDDQQIIIRKGVISKRELTLPLAKITDVSVDQDIFDFILGLYDVHISTPTVESGKFAHIDGLDKESALKLKKMILERIHHANREQSRPSE